MASTFKSKRFISLETTLAGLFVEPEIDFKEYDKYKETDNAKYLLYKREYIAITEYLKTL